MTRRLLLPVLLLAAAGCVSPAGPRDTAGWFSARGADLMDVVGVRVMLGPGLGVYVRATEYAQLGAVFRGPSERTVPTPEGQAIRSVPCFVFGTIGRYGGAWFERASEVMLPGWSSRDDDPLLIDREVVAGIVPLHGEDDRWRASFGAGVHLLLVGVEAEVRPLQVLDLLAGLVGYDPSGDDVPVASSAGEDRPEI